MSARGNPTAAARRLGNRIAPPRFLVFLALFGGVSLGWHVWVPGSGWADAAAMGFDFAAAMFIASLWPLFSECSPERLRTHSRENDANRLLVLIVTTLVTVVVMAAIAGEWPNVEFLKRVTRLDSLYFSCLSMASNTFTYSFFSPMV